MFCSNCGTKLIETSNYCSNCGTLINSEKKIDQKDIEKENSSNLYKNIKESQSSFKYRNSKKIIFLTILTFGLYHYYLLYLWIKAINKAQEKIFFNPCLALFICIITFGLGSIYFDFQITKRSEYIAMKTKDDLDLSRQNIRKPSEALKDLTILGNIFIFSIQVFSSMSFFGIILAYIIAFFIATWINIKIQRSIEYMLCIKR